MAHLSSNEEAFYNQFFNEPLRGTIHLLGCRQQILGKFTTIANALEVPLDLLFLIDNAAIIFPNFRENHFKILLRFDENKCWTAFLTIGDGRGGWHTLRESPSNLYSQTPDIAYMALLIQLCQDIDSPPSLAD